MKKRIVVKIGTNTITNKDGSINNILLNNIVLQLKGIKNSHDVIIVTSGAIGAGVKCLKLDNFPRDIRMRQAAAAIGQTELMKHWQQAFGTQSVAQLLLSYNSFTNRKSYLNLSNTINTLLLMNVIPIINENDPVATDEINDSFGDNDILSALVASKSNAELLIILSDIDGLYNKDPKQNKNVGVIREVHEITSDIKAMAHTSSSRGRGGMVSKLEAANICMNSGVQMYIVNGNEQNVIQKVVENKLVGTHFLPIKELPEKKRWIFNSPASGKIFVDDLVEQRLRQGNNLLPAGINKVEGNFEKGDVVELIHANISFAKAIIDYSSLELNKIKKQRGLKNVVRRENLLII